MDVVGGRLVFYNCFGAPGRIRTYDLRLRSPLLYPAELQGQVEYTYGAGEGN